MVCIDVTLPSPEENLACDEALLDACEGDGAEEALRFWEPAQYFAVVGYANVAAREVNLPFCEANGIPVLRRCTGGGTVLQGPGCLNYSLVLRISETGPLRSISGANEFILKRHREILSAALGKEVELRGQTDLAIGEVKFSGNAQRRKREWLIFHGTFLLDFDIPLIAQALPMPSKQPDYRGQRGHEDFLTNLAVSAEKMKGALREAWSAKNERVEVPVGRIEQLVREKYGKADWNLGRRSVESEAGANDE
jgi:lipoate-protein ligase A